MNTASSFDPPPIPYCTRCGVADARVTHACPPLSGEHVCWSPLDLYPPNMRTSWSLTEDTFSSPTISVAAIVDKLR